MKFIFLIASAALFLAGCAQDSSNISYENTQSQVDEYAGNGIVCAKLSTGEKQTFPSMKELSKVKDAQYLYDGPCYSK